MALNWYVGRDSDLLLISNMDFYFAALWCRAVASILSCAWDLIWLIINWNVMFEPHGGRYGFLFVELSIHVISTDEANAYIWVSNVCTASSSEVKGHCILNLYMWCWVRCVHTLIDVDDLHTRTQRTIHACTHAHQCNCKGPALEQIVARCSNKMQFWIPPLPIHVYVSVHDVYHSQASH